MSELKPSVGAATVEGPSVSKPSGPVRAYYVMQDTALGEQTTCMVTANEGDGPAAKVDADFIAEAFNVYFYEGLTPVQLLAKVKAAKGLEEALQELVTRREAVSYNERQKSGSDGRYDRARAALAAFRGSK